MHTTWPTIASWVQTTYKNYQWFHNLATTKLKLSTLVITSDQNSCLKRVIDKLCERESVSVYLDYRKFLCWKPKRTRCSTSRSSG